MKLIDNENTTQQKAMCTQYTNKNEIAIDREREQNYFNNDH